MPLSTVAEYSRLRSVKNAASGAGSISMISGVDVRWCREETLSVADLHDRVEFDLPVRLAWHDFEEIAIRPDGLVRYTADVGTSHLVLMYTVVLSVNLDFELLGTLSGVFILVVVCHWSYLRV